MSEFSLEDDPALSQLTPALPKEIRSGLNELKNVA